MKGEFPEVVCLFCQRKLETPADYQQAYNCVCGAKFMVYSHEDLSLASSEGSDIFGLYGIYLEVRIQEDFDILTNFEGQDPATGERQALVFVRPKEQWGELHRLALEKRPQAPQYQRNSFARAVMALTGVVQLGQAGAGPTSREYAALRLHGRKDEADKLVPLTIQESAEMLIAEDGVIFGAISAIHRQCWIEEFCFGDDPQDVAELKTSTDKPE